MTHYMLERNGKFLNERYEWSLMPHSFGWNFDRVLELAMCFKDRPTQIGEVMQDGTVVFTQV